MKKQLELQAAYNLVKAALESKAITLEGPTPDIEPEDAGARDARYLIALIRGLQSPQPD